MTTYHDLPTKHLIDGQWIDGIGKRDIIVDNPATGDRLATFSAATSEQVSLAVEAAHRASLSWRETSARDRARMLHNWHELVLEHIDTLAEILTAEHGKPMRESRAEVLAGAAYIEWFAEEGRRLYGETIPPDSPGRHLTTYREPIGVVGVITPWNFPSGMLPRKVAAALAAGCTTVIKPASETPLSAIALVVLAERAGIPPGVVNIVSGPAAQIGNELMRNPLVRKISFTGSTRVGKLLAEGSVPTLKRLSLELGGNAPFIIFADADIDLAVEHAVSAKFRGAGQTCVAANRILVQDEIYDKFVTRFVERVSHLHVGPGDEEETDIGPVINADALRRLEELLKDGIELGGRVMTGGTPHERHGLYMAPTVVVDAHDRMRAWQEEIFGPLAFVYRFAEEEEAVRRANATPYGLAAYLYTTDYRRIHRLAPRIEAGMVGVNEWLVASETAPFGGIKESGMGREGSRHGLDDYTQLKYVCVGGTV